MRDVGQGAKLSLEPIDVGRFRQRQGLQRYNPVLIPIVRFVDDAHASGSQATPQGEARSADEFLGGIYHWGTSNAGATTNVLTDAQLCLT